ncbi:fumarate reductase [candidate division TA06 bacterium SM23_40]|uniref:Fumarate reductase n=1 Tax=candidate division TA06 bacterium SM23_40 TaxID=1703774 RepID=A0A0S8G7J3_UNCT6|nr:MAG: fumarate reductase [candidate division TA06 bacterium SM23_40]
MYTEAMRQSIKILEGTRAFRKTQELGLMSPDEKAQLLRDHHPDYKGEQQRELRVGPSRGDRAPHEIADLIEARSLVDPEDFDLSRIDHDVDVLVVGGGGAGGAAALLARESGASVLLATKLRFGDANTMMAQGGIQAADKSHDSPSIHYLDVIGGGGFHNDPALVRALVIDAPKVIGWLEEMGVMFDKEPDGTMVTIHGGGTSRKRMHSARDYSGGDIMKVIRDEVLNQDIEVIEFSPVVELLTDGKGRCTGAILYNMETQEYSIVRAKATVIATGGAGRLHVQGFPTTNHYGATADGLVLAYRAGCELAFMDTIQYHPTGAAYPEQIVGQLVTEKVRGLGAQLVNGEGNRFVYELETRDAESAAIIRECTERNLGVVTPSGMRGVWLDSPLIEEIHGSGTIQRLLPAMYRQYERFEIDMTADPILVYPTQHYQNGGIVIDDQGASQIEGLYVAGEVAGGVHGRNRLMGNSLLDIVVFGRRAGAAAALRAKETVPGELGLDHVRRYHEELEKNGVETTRRAPMLLPDYRPDELKSHLITIGS